VGLNGYGVCSNLASSGEPPPLLHNTTLTTEPGLTRYTKKTRRLLSQEDRVLDEPLFHATMPTKHSCGSRCRMQLLGRQNNNASLHATPHTADTFLKFFGDKVQAVRSCTGHAPAAVIRRDWCHAVVVITLFGRGGSSRGHRVVNEVLSARSNSHVLAKGMHRQSSSIKATVSKAAW